MKIVTENLAQLAEQIVDAKLLIGAVAGRSGWDNPEQCNPSDIESLMFNAAYQRKWANVVTYASMLAAITINESQGHTNDNDNPDGS